MMELRYKLIIRNLFIGICCVILQSASLAAPNIEGIQIYQKNPHLSEERKQSLEDAIDLYHNADNLWDVLRSEFSLPHYEDNPYVQEQIDWFMNHQAFLINTANRAGPYLYYILQQARKRHLPAEVVLLPMIESAYNPFVYSPAGAAGIWQMMPDTASGFGIKQNWWYDGRRDVIASTKAALNYLAYLGGFFGGNWLLAMAAYDTGEGNVLAAIRKNSRDGKSTDFWSLPVAQETREYIPRVMALATIIAHPEEYPIDFPAIRNAPYLAQIDVGGQIDLREAAYFAGISFHALKQLNPGYNRSATDPNGPYKLVLPIENVERFTENLVRSPLYHRIYWEHYKIKSGDTLVAIAKKFNTTPDSIRKMNSLSSNELKLGAKLVVPHTVTTLSKTLLHTAPTPPLSPHYKLQPGDTLYMVRDGDSLQKIADRFQMDIKTLLTTNQLHSTHKLIPGGKLIIPTHLAKTHSPKNISIAPGDTVYIVRRGDTVEKIAHKFHTTPPHIRLTNLLASNTIQEGDRLVIPAKG